MFSITTMTTWNSISRFTSNKFVCTMTLVLLLANDVVSLRGGDVGWVNSGQRLSASRLSLWQTSNTAEKKSNFFRRNNIMRMSLLSSEKENYDGTQEEFPSSSSSASVRLLETLIAQKEQAVAEEDYLQAATLKQQIDDLQEAAAIVEPFQKVGSSSSSSTMTTSSQQQQQQQQQSPPGLTLDWDSATPLNMGDNLQWPPMWEVPCLVSSFSSPSKSSSSLLNKIIKPPHSEALWQWYEARGDWEADPSWADVWPSASSLVAVLMSMSNNTNDDSRNVNAKANITPPTSTTTNAILDSSFSVRGKTVVELGCGLGVAGLTAASLGASSVIFMDREPHALHCAMSSASLNGYMTTAQDSSSIEPQPPVVQAAVVDWSKVAKAATVTGSSVASTTRNLENDKDQEKEDGVNNNDSTSTSSSGNIIQQYRSSADVILCSDVLYDADTVRDLVHVMGQLIRKDYQQQSDDDDGTGGGGGGGGRVFVTDPAIERVPGIQKVFCDALTQLGATTVDVTLLPPVVTATLKTPSSSLSSTDRTGERTVLISAQW